ncbi:MAG: MFS transporter [Desulfobacterales bacterium]|nr:MFS transporter [Desulfobacterales bacterium]
MIVSVFSSLPWIPGAVWPSGKGVLILARTLQSAAAGVLRPLSMQVIFHVFSPEKRGTTMRIYALGAVLAPAFGPMLDGMMVDSFDWRYIFFLSIPPALLGMFLTTIFMPGSFNNR